MLYQAQLIYAMIRVSLVWGAVWVLGLGWLGVGDLRDWRCRCQLS